MWSHCVCVCVCGGRGWGPTGLCLLSTDCCPMLLRVHVDFMFCTHPLWPTSSGQQSADFWPFQRCWCLPDCSPRGARCETLLSQGWLAALVILLISCGCSCVQFCKLLGVPRSSLPPHPICCYLLWLFWMGDNTQRTLSLYFDLLRVLSC